MDSSIGPLSVLDDATRYALALENTGSSRGEAVRERLASTFQACGLPDGMLMDHGCPCGISKLLVVGRSYRCG